jgi:hypothetical protein
MGKFLFLEVIHSVWVSRVCECKGLDRRFYWDFGANFLGEWLPEREEKHELTAGSFSALSCQLARCRDFGPESWDGSPSTSVL